MANQIIIGKKHRVIKNVPTSDGMLYENDIVIVTDLSSGETARVEDMTGRIFHISPRVLQLIV